MQLCDGFDIPVVNFCDTPGIMVGTGGVEDRPGQACGPACS
jgi:acetyl-CoA carboxylase carboxyltransferase component